METFSFTSLFKNSFPLKWRCTPLALSGERGRGKGAILFFALMMLTACSKQAADTQAQTPEEVCAQIGFAWNLGNHFDSFHYAPDATPQTAGYWDNSTPTEALYKSLAENGVKCVRIPVTWGPWQTEAPEYTINPEFIELVRQNVLWAKEAGLAVILNTHHDEYWQDIYGATLSDSLNEVIKLRIERTWSQVAEAFKEEGHYLYFEVFNEIHAKAPEFEDWSGQWARQEGNPAIEILNSWIEIGVRAIRATGSVNATRWIAINGYCGNPGFTFEHLRLPDDEAGRLMISVHTYWPVDFTLEDKRETWGTGKQQEEDEAAVRDLFRRLGEQFTSKGVPVYLGEFGCDAHATEEGEACRLRYLTMIGEEAKKANVPVVIWDNSYPGAGPEHHAYFDHNDGHVVPGAEKIIESLSKIF